MVQRMQTTIELGRKIRDNKNVSIKNPLSKVTIVQSDKQAIEDLNRMSQYIKDELNCLEFEIVSNEEEYVVYQTTPDHKEMGSALKKAYTKSLKEKVAQLNRDQVLEYLRNGKLELEGVVIKDGWL